jgi:hypothetical protein
MLYELLPNHSSGQYIATSSKNLNFIERYPKFWNIYARESQYGFDLNFVDVGERAALTDSSTKGRFKKMVRGRKGGKRKIRGRTRGERRREAGVGQSC